MENNARSFQFSVWLLQENRPDQFEKKSSPNTFLLAIKLKKKITFGAYKTVRTSSLF